MGYSRKNREYQQGGGFEGHAIFKGNYPVNRKWTFQRLFKK